MTDGYFWVRGDKRTIFGRVFVLDLFRIFRPFLIKKSLIQQNAFIWTCASSPKLIGPTKVFHENPSKLSEIQPKPIFRLSPMFWVCCWSKSNDRRFSCNSYLQILMNYGFFFHKMRLTQAFNQLIWHVSFRIRMWIPKNKRFLFWTWLNIAINFHCSSNV